MEAWKEVRWRERVELERGGMVDRPFLPIVLLSVWDTDVLL